MWAGRNKEGDNNNGCVIGVGSYRVFAMVCQCCPFSSVFQDGR